MNVKPGDLAIVVKSTQNHNLGKICKVLSAYGNFMMSNGSTAFGWNVEFPNPIKWTYGGVSKTGVSPDHYLRPISGLPDTEETDEQQPIKETA